MERAGALLIAESRHQLDRLLKAIVDARQHLVELRIYRLLGVGAATAEQVVELVEGFEVERAVRIVELDLQALAKVDGVELDTTPGAVERVVAQLRGRSQAPREHRPAAPLLALARWLGSPHRRPAASLTLNRMDARR